MRDYVRWKENCVRKKDVARENSYVRGNVRERYTGNREMRLLNWLEKGKDSGMEIDQSFLQQLYLCLLF